MRMLTIGLSTALTLATAGLVTGPANAAIVVGTFSGVVTSGEARGNFGYAYDTPGDLTGKSITGTFRYDTDRLGPNCQPDSDFFGCFLGSGVSMTQTIDGVTEAFPGDPLPGSPAFNSADGAVLLYDLVGDAVNIYTRTWLGDPATVFDGRETGLSLILAPGGVGDATDPVITYDGAPLGLGYAYSMGGLTLLNNETYIYQLTEGFFTQNTRFAFRVDTFTSAAAVPEPTSWAFMILGFGLAGSLVRRRRGDVLAV
ncbi:MAG: PEPxxWA-CTERM sorting domain-containing protein [Phenylobacterium sp.]|nr:PEPxxWA-CTERM sorting domain-containing protein [Phenylobacterium sp.]